MLSSLKHYWLVFGEKLGAIVTPIVMLGLYFLILSPVAILCRILGRDVLFLRKSNSFATFWQTCDDEPNSMQNIDFEKQF